MEPAASKLPTYAALKATYGEAPYKYLGVEDDGKVAYTTDKVVSLRAKFALEYAGDGLVHIRSSYNNKYWVRSSESEYWIVAAADSPVEDKTAWNCTLFSYDTSGDGSNVTFVHEQLGKPVGRRDVAPDREMYLCLEPTATTTDVSAVVDYDLLVILPQYVAFKDEDGLYLSSLSPMNPCVFINDDIGKDGNAFEVVTTRDGHIYLKYNTADLFNGLCWSTRGTHPVLPYPEGSIYCNVLYNPVEGEVDNDPPDDSGVAVFSVVKSGTSIALLHLESNKYVERRSLYDQAEEAGPWALRVSSKTITNKAKLKVVEPILGRQVDVFEFHLDRARIYDRVPLTYAEGGASNSTDSDGQEYTLAFTYSKNTSSTWTTTESWYIDATVSVTSKIPFIGESSIEIGSGYSHDYEWGTTIENSEQVTSSYTVQVPAMTKAKVYAIATQATCDIPYSYEKIDQLPNGQLQRTTLSNGLYTGINAYNFDFNVVYEPINI